MLENKEFDTEVLEGLITEPRHYQDFVNRNFIPHPLAVDLTTAVYDSETLKAAKPSDISYIIMVGGSAAKTWLLHSAFGNPVQLNDVDLKLGIIEGAQRHSYQTYRHFVGAVQTEVSRIAAEMEVKLCHHFRPEVQPFVLARDWHANRRSIANYAYNMAEGHAILMQTSPGPGVDLSVNYIRRTFSQQEADEILHSAVTTYEFQRRTIDDKHINRLPLSDYEKQVVLKDLRAHGYSLTSEVVVPVGQVASGQ
jgi:hypothetical protein